jgi:hypothetical protein
MDVRLRTFGGLEVEGLGSHRLGSRKARTLLKLLALARGRPVGVEHLIDCLAGRGGGAGATGKTIEGARQSAAGNSGSRARATN